ncbi:MAG: GatB/YqeY domain-containing protein [Epsilonproteobacteria bacterium]|nr:GatB/YqeY domain-containing protein [Campylobacterota bacterium]
MSLKDRLKSDLKDAMRNKDSFKRDVLRNLTAAIKQEEVDKRVELSDSDIEKILFKYAKQREDALAQFKAANREDLVEKEKKELEIVLAYLPKPLSDEELMEATKEAIKETKASSMRDMGKIMGYLKEKYGSRVDGSKVNKIVKELLN